MSEEVIVRVNDNARQVCIDGEAGWDNPEDKDCIVGKCYPVSDVYKEYIFVKDDSGYDSCYWCLDYGAFTVVKGDLECLRRK